MKELTFSGYNLISAGLSPFQEKVNIVKDFPLPNTIKKLRQFLWVMNYYHRLINHAADKLQCLSDELKGKSENSKAAIKLNDKALQAFENIKEVFDTVSFLAYPAPGAEIALITDASNLAIGAVLQQKVKDKWLPISFYRHRLTDPQSKFSSFDRGILAIFMAVKHFDNFLKEKPFTIFTDHKPIISAIHSSNTHLESHANIIHC